MLQRCDGSKWKARAEHALAPDHTLGPLASGREVPGKKDWIRRPNQNDKQALNLPGAGDRSVEN